MAAAVYDGCPFSRFGLLDGGVRELGRAKVLAGVGVGLEGLLDVLPGGAFGFGVGGGGGGGAAAEGAVAAAGVALGRRSGEPLP